MVHRHLLQVLCIWKWFSHTNYNIEYENSKKYPVHFQFKKQRLKKQIWILPVKMRSKESLQNLRRLKKTNIFLKLNF